MVDRLIPCLSNLSLGMRSKPTGMEQQEQQQPEVGEKRALRFFQSQPIPPPEVPMYYTPGTPIEPVAPPADWTAPKEDGEIKRFKEENFPGAKKPSHVRITYFKAVNGAWVKTATTYEHVRKRYTVYFKTNQGGHASVMRFEYNDMYLVYAGNPGQECLILEVRNTGKLSGEETFYWSCNNPYGVPVLERSSKVLPGGARERKTYTVSVWDNQTPLYANRDWLDVPDAKK